jgi:hypothetical protein
MSLIALKPIENLVSLALWSAYLANERPLSILIVSKIESGKTELLSQFRGNRGVQYLTDCTAFGLAKSVLPSILEGKINHIIIPDLLIPLSHSRDTSNNLIALLNALIEEGVINIQTFFHRAPPYKYPVRCGIITAIAKEEFEERKDYWGKLGFVSRCLTITYSHSWETQHKVREFLAEDLKEHEPIIWQFPEAKQEITIPEIIKEQLIEWIETSPAVRKSYAYRLQIHLQRLMKARALANRREVVSEEDYERVMSYSKYINFNYNEV